MGFIIKGTKQYLKNNLLNNWNKRNPKKEMDKIQPNYIISGRIRTVDPYFQTITTTVKARWSKRTVLDVFSSEFRSFTPAEYKKRLENEEIIVIHPIKLSKKEKRSMKEGSAKENKKIIKYPEIMDHKLIGNDVIQRIEHIHERSIFGVEKDNLEVVFEDDNILVVNKPSGIPIHPVQNYYYNSLVKILENEGWPNEKPRIGELILRPCYRLDKLTSGVCILAKNTETARKIQMDIQNRDVEKVYLARVKGKFPEGKTRCDHDIIILDTKKGKVDGITRKPAETIFELVSYNKELDQSIIRCFPKTGRTHQIRIHLRNLQHPIMNDPLYGNGKLMELKDGADYKEISEDYFDIISKQAEDNRVEAESNEICQTCDAKLYKQQKPEDMVMYLHAYKYKLNHVDGWEFETKLPDWCSI